MDWLKTILGYLKLKQRYLFGLSVVCLVIVGLPKACRVYLGYDELIKQYRGWISLVGIASGVYWFVMVIAGFPHWVLDKWQERILWKKAKNNLLKLSPDEKGYIAKYIKGNVSSCEFHLGDGIINGLEAKSVVYRAANISRRGSYFDFNLQPWVLKALDEYSDVKEDMLKHYFELV